MVSSKKADKIFEQIKGTLRARKAKWWRLKLIAGTILSVKMCLKRTKKELKNILTRSSGSVLAKIL